MNFIGVGPLELVVVLLVALIFVGPDRLPRLAADLARTIREIRRYTGSLAAEFNEVVKDLEKDTGDDRAEWKEIGRGLSEASQAVTDAVRAAGEDAAQSGTNGVSPAAPPATNGTQPAPVPEPKETPQ